MQTTQRAHDQRAFIRGVHAKKPTAIYDLATGAKKMTSELRREDIEFKAGQGTLSSDEVMISEIELLEHIRMS